MNKERVLYCSICSKDEHQVRALIAADNGICICNECVQVCNDALFDLLKRSKDEIPEAPKA